MPGTKGHFRFGSISLASLLSLSSACDAPPSLVNDEEEVNEDQARLQVILDVAPITSYSAVYLTPKALHLKGPQFDETIPLEVGQIELTGLEGAAELALGAVTLPATRATKIELVFEETGQIVTTLGQTFDLELPSKRVRVASSFDLEPGMTTRLTVDILSEVSVHPASDRYIMHPVLHAKSVETFAVDGADPREHSYTAIVGDQGGSVYLLDGRGLEIPAGALPENTPVTVTAINVEQLAGPLDLPGYLGGDKAEVLDGLSLEPHGVELAEQAVLTLHPEQNPGDGTILIPVVRESEPEPWQAYGTDVAGTDVAVTLDDGRVVSAIDSFSDHGIVEFTLDVGPFDEKLSLEELFELEGSELHYWRLPGLGGPDLVEGFWAPFHARGLKDEDFRQDRWKEVLETVVSRRELDADTRYADAIAATSAWVGKKLDQAETVFLADEWFDILPKEVVIETLTEEELLSLWAEYIEFDDGRTLLISAGYSAERITIYERTATDLSGFWQQVGSAVEVASLAVDTVDVINAALISQSITADWIQSMDEIFNESDLVDDPAFVAAWAQVKAEAEASRESAFQAMLWTLKSEPVEQAALELLENGTGFVIGRWVSRALSSRYGRWGTKAAAYLGLLVDSVIVNVNDTIGVHREAARIALTSTLFAEAFYKPFDSAVERYRQEGAVYVLWKLYVDSNEWYYNPDASGLSRGAAFIARSVTGRLSGWREGRTLYEARRDELEAKVADFLFGDAVRPASVSQDDASIIDETSPEFVRSGPENYWHPEFFPGAGYGDTLLWTQNNQIGIVGVENRGIWSSAEWTGSDAAEIKVQIPDAGYANAQVCYIIETIGGPYYRMVDQSEHAGQLLSLGLYPSAPGQVIKVTLQDTTPDAHLSKRIGYDAVHFESVPASSAPAPGVDCRGSQAWFPPGSERVRFAVGDGSLPTPARNDDPWYDAQPFASTAYRGKPHLGSDWNRDGANDQGESVFTPGNTQEVLFAGKAGAGWDGVVILRLVSWNDPFIMPDTLERTTDVIVMLAHLDPVSIPWSTGEVIEGQGVFVGKIGPAPCSAPGCGSHLHLEVASIFAAKWPGPGYSWNLDGRVDPTAFFSLNGA